VSQWLRCTDCKRDPSIRKCTGVRAVKSDESSEGWCERSQVKHSHYLREKSTVLFVKMRPSVIVYKYVLVVFTLLSHNPPKSGARGGMKCHSVRYSANLALIFSVKNLYNSLRYLTAPTKLVPLSEKIWAHKPFRDVNQCKEIINAFVEKSVTISRCTAFILVQTNIDIFFTNVDPSSALAFPKLN